MTLTPDERFRIAYALRALAGRRIEQAQDYRDKRKQAVRQESEELRKLASRIVKEDE